MESRHNAPLQLARFHYRANHNMAKQVLQSGFDTILRVISRFAEGVSTEEILGAKEINLPRRTLQRRLALLVAQKKIVAEGRGRACRYRLSTPEPSIKPVSHQPLVRDLASYLPVSSPGEEIKQLVCRPIQGRHPVGYNRKFLDNYRPNKTFYLTKNIRQQLMARGKSSQEQRPAGTYAHQIFNRLLIDLSWNSSRLEGNTYSLLETQRLLEMGEATEGKKALEAQMILNHKAAIELLVDQSSELGFNRYSILNLHALLSDNLLADPQACGRLRTIPVGIAKTVYHPLEVPQQIDECFQQLLDTTAAIEDPFEQSFFFMVQMPYLQPFEDANKRVSRLAANLPFIRENLSPLSFVDVPARAYIDGILGVYELNRIELLRDVFVWAYERSCARYAAVRQSLGSPDPFRLRHRDSIVNTVAKIVLNGLDKKTAAIFIKQRAGELAAPDDRPKFIEVVETEIISLHEGNIARYHLRPSQYQAWEKTWR